MIVESEQSSLNPVDSFSEPVLQVVSDLISSLGARISAEVRREFNQKLREAIATIEEERDHLRQELAAARRDAAEISAELSEKQAELEHLNREIALMLEDPNIELSRIIHHKALVVELSSYIKGLQYLSREVVCEKSTTLGPELQIQ